MHPCSQPRYGLTERSNPMSGESLRVMTDRATSILTVVANGGSGSSSVGASISAVRCTDSKRCGALETAPRPLRTNRTGAVGSRTGSSAGIRSTGPSGEVVGERTLDLRRYLVDPHCVAGMVNADCDRGTVSEGVDRGAIELESQEMYRRRLLLVLAFQV